MCLFFFFQAEDGIRDLTVTGVQTCALPILLVLFVVVPYVVLSSLHTRRLERLPALLREAVQEEQRDARRDDYAGPGGVYDVFVVVPALAGVIGGGTALGYAARAFGPRRDRPPRILGAALLA